MNDELATFAAAAAIAMLSTSAHNLSSVRKFGGNYLAKFTTPPAGYSRPLYMVCTELAEGLVLRYKGKKQ